MQQTDDESTGPGGGGVRVRFRGTRGSIASPGPHTSRFGGNTPCIEVVANGQRLVFDAGTGIRSLGDELMARRDRGAGDPVRATLFLSHFHWDHVQGFPFFAPIYDASSELHVVGPAQTSPDGAPIPVRSLVEGLFGSSYFPIPPSSIAESCTFGHLNEGTWEHGGVTVRAMRVKHPSFTVGYRVDAGGRSIAYVPDNELASDAYDVGVDWWPRFVGFLAGVDVLVHDAMFTDEEHEARKGHGHSSISEVIDLADEVHAGEVALFHHAPTRSDDELDDLVERARDDLLADGRSFGLRAAREGEEIRLANVVPGADVARGRGGDGG